MSELEYNQVKQRKKKSGCKACCSSMFKKMTNDKVIVMSFKQSVYCNFCVMLVVFLIAIGLKLGTTPPEEFSIRYDDKCKGINGSCKFLVTVPVDIKKPVYFYLGYKDYFVNHRNVVNSYSKAQNNGDVINLSTAQTDCPKMVKNKEGAKSLSYGGTALNPEEVMSPCGIFASLRPTVDLQIYRRTAASTATTVEGTDVQVGLATDKIIWDKLKGNKFKRDSNSLTKQWADPEDERYIKWVKPPMLSTFEKLWAVSENSDILKGTYLIDITNDVTLEPFKIEKTLVIRQLNGQGGKNPHFFTVYLIAGILLLIIGLGMFVTMKKLEGRKSTDQQ